MKTFYVRDFGLVVPGFHVCEAIDGGGCRVLCHSDDKATADDICASLRLAESIRTVLGSGVSLALVRGGCGVKLRIEVDAPRSLFVGAVVFLQATVRDRAHIARRDVERVVKQQLADLLRRQIESRDRVPNAAPAALDPAVLRRREAADAVVKRLFPEMSLGSSLEVAV